MSGLPARHSGPASGRESPQSGWAGAVPEICIAVIVIGCAAVTGYAAGGVAGTAVVMAVAAVLALALARIIATGSGTRPGDGRVVGADIEAIPGTFGGFWRRRAGLADAAQSLSAYDTGLRTTLQHLLAARLAERHGISLQDNPAAARRLLCRRRGDEGLWFWVDPARPAAPTGPAGYLPGIPPRTLALLIDRLERL